MASFQNAFNRRDGYGWMAVFLHWLLVLLIFGMIAGGKYSASLGPGEKISWLIGFHKQAGIAVFALMAFRLLWRLFNTSPAAPPDQSWTVTVSAFIVHWLLYILVLLQAATGVFMSHLSGRDVEFLGAKLPSFEEQGGQLLDAIPAVPALSSFLFGEAAEAGEKMRALHTVLGDAAIALIALHVLAALLGNFFFGRDTLRRMSFAR